MATTNNKLAKDASLQSILLANRSIAEAEQARNTTLAAILAEMKSRSTNIQAWKDAVLSLSTADKTALASAIYEVLGLNGSAQKSAQALPDIYAIFDENSNAENGAMIHNSLPRGKFLGSNLSEELYANIRAATFKGLWAGDYVQFTNVPYIYNSTEYTYSGDWLWGDSNYRIHSGYPSEVTRNHGAMLPREPLFNAPMNPTNTTENGYVGSEMYAEHMKRAEAIVKACFGEEHVVPYYPIFVNAVANGKPSGYAYVGARYIDLMNEAMVYGHYHFSSGGSDGTTIPASYDMDKSQLAIFKHDHSLEHRRSASYWLRDVVSGGGFARVADFGYALYYFASDVIGVRPAALIG